MPLAQLDHLGKVRHVGQVDGHLEHAVEPRSGDLQQPGDVGEHLFRLGVEIAYAHQRARLVQRRLPDRGQRDMVARRAMTDATPSPDMSMTRRSAQRPGSRNSSSAAWMPTPISVLPLTDRFLRRISDAKVTRPVRP